MQRYFTKIKKENTFILDFNDLYHITRVMRMKSNDKIEVVYNKVTYLCEVLIINDDISINIIEKKKEDNELPIKLTIAVALLKEQKFDLIIQKCTELGVNEFVPVIMDRSVVKVDNEKEEKKLLRWQKIAKEASRQSKRNIIPIVSKIITLKDLSKMEYDLKLIASTNENINSIKKVLKNVTNYDTMIIVMGPEGGITSYEEEFLEDNGYIKVTLGKRILRAETAPIVGASIINYEVMD